MEQWQVLLERFLRNECTERENKFVYHVFRNGLIDDEFRCAVDSFMNDEETLAYIDRMKSLPDDVLKNIRCRLTKRTEKPDERQRRIIPEWLKIAVVAVIALTASWIVFHTKTDTKEPEIAMHTITVPAGQTVNLMLADGTNIWLNARSTMKYPGIFTGNRREVILEGEGFFDVAHNPDKPFVVHADKYDILALGTQFDVESYPSDNVFSTSLLDGSVKVTSIDDSTQTIVLHPNTMMRLYGGKLVTENIADYNHFRWREGLICFEDMPFIDLLTKFERCYGIKIIVQNSRVKDYTPTGKFRQSDGIDYALRVLQRYFRFRFERDEENHVIYIK